MHTPNALCPEVGGALLSGGKHTTFCTFLVHSLSLQICFKLDAGQRLRNKLTGINQINWSFSKGKGGYQETGWEKTLPKGCQQPGSMSIIPTNYSHCRFWAEPGNQMHPASLAPPCSTSRANGKGCKVDWQLGLTLCCSRPPQPVRCSNLDIYTGGKIAELFAEALLC